VCECEKIVIVSSDLYMCASNGVVIAQLTSCEHKKRHFDSVFIFQSNGSHWSWKRFVNNILKNMFHGTK